ncbi:MAG: TonB family protein [Nitrospiraceae bacterium]|jgi:Ca-activated chloride channel family protein|nr:TonB family protein [Nitrospiraceae bacterium]
MKTLLKYLTFFCLVAFVAGSVAATPMATKEATDKTLSPYFFVKSDDPSTDQLPLKSTSANVSISGVIADVAVTQVYKNTGKRPIEAIYVFPASTRAAVYGMKMTIGKRVIVAKINKREDARREYEQAKKAGQSASLLEQQRPNVFQMNVANIMPGDEIKVELKYTELLVPTDKTYSFVYPTVVGPRYSNQTAETAGEADRWTQNPYLKQGEAASYAFDISVKLAAGMPIQKIASTSHKISVQYNGLSSAKILLDTAEANGGNRDYILNYRLDGDKVETGLLLSKGEKENFFLLMLQPPKHVNADQMPGREYIFIVDVSGSMHGFPLDISKKLMQNLLGNLRPTDTFNLLLFSGGSSVLANQSLPATPSNIAQAVQLIERQRGGGGTELLPALQRALALPKTKGYSRTVVIATDGYVGVETEAFDLIRKNLGEANMFTFGIGSSVNRHLLEGMARVGMGESFVISKAAEASAQAERFRKMIQTPVLTQVKLDFGKFEVYDVEPIAVPDVLAERPIIVFGKWRGEPKGAITMSGIAGDRKISQKIDVRGTQASQDNEALKYLWARHRIALLSDYNALRPDDKRVAEVTDLGLKYNLLTAYTSFVAVDSEVRNASGDSTAIKQPLPLPEGVSDYAVGGRAYAAAPGMMPMSRQKKADMALAYEKHEVKRSAGPVLDSVVVSEAALQERIARTVQSRVKELHGCVSSAISGKVVLQFEIDRNGAVKKLKVKSSGLNNAAADRCIFEAMEKWQFAALSADTSVRVTLTISF